MSLEQIRGIINGLYLAIKEDDSGLLNKTAGEIDGGLVNPLFRAYVGYGNLPFHSVYNVMKLSAEFFNNYYGKAPINDGVESDEFWQNVMVDADNILKVISNSEDENSFLYIYARHIMVEALSVIEQEYVSRRKQNNSLGEKEE